MDDIASLLLDGKNEDLNINIIPCRPILVVKISNTVHVFKRNSPFSYWYY